MSETEDRVKFLETKANYYLRSLHQLRETQPSEDASASKHIEVTQRELRKVRDKLVQLGGSEMVEALNQELGD